MKSHKIEWELDEQDGILWLYAYKRKWFFWETKVWMGSVTPYVDRLMLPKKIVYLAYFTQDPFLGNLKEFSTSDEAKNYLEDRLVRWLRRGNTI